MPTMITRICPICDQPFQIAIKRVNAGGGIYCSRRCVHKLLWKGGKIASSMRSRQNRKVKKWKKHLSYNRTYNRNYRETVHGHLILTFHKMKMRCEDPKYQGYRWYGGRGIQCKFRSSKEFAEYVINNLQVDPRGLDIDRIDSNKHYEPGNIRFVTHKENMRNRRKKGGQ